jgi:hypothetical protein
LAKKQSLQERNLTSDMDKVILVTHAFDKLSIHTFTYIWSSENRKLFFFHKRVFSTPLQRLLSSKIYLPLTLSFRRLTWKLSLKAFLFYLPLCKICTTYVQIGKYTVQH